MNISFVGRKQRRDNTDHKVRVRKVNKGYANEIGSIPLTKTLGQ